MMDELLESLSQLYWKQQDLITRHNAGLAALERTIDVSERSSIQSYVQPIKWTSQDPWQVHSNSTNPL